MANGIKWKILHSSKNLSKETTYSNINNIYNQIIVSYDYVYTKKWSVTVFIHDTEISTSFKFSKKLEALKFGKDWCDKKITSI